MNVRSIATLAVVVAVVVACGDTLPLNEDPLPAPADCSADKSTDAKNCGACGVVCGGAERCAASVCVPGCVSKTIFVSKPLGNDANDGCTELTPLGTINAAIARAKTLGALDHKIHVCGGRYDEVVNLNHPVSLHGAFDCKTWKRDPNFGYPNLDAIRTTIQNPAPAGLASLLVYGDVSRAVEIDGLDIVGPESGPGADNDRVSGVTISDGASPSMHDNTIVGGGAGVKGTSYAIAVSSRTSPEISRSHLNGGAGKLGSFGIFVDTAKPFIHDVAVNPGASPSTKAGIFVTGGSVMTGPNALTNAFVAWDLKATGIGDGIRIGSVGDDGLLVDIIGAVVRSGTVTCPVPAAAFACRSTGVNVVSGTVSIDRSRIAGGRIETPQPDSTTTGVLIGSGAVHITNSMIHAGNKEYEAIETNGVLASPSTKSLTLQHNTIIAVGSTTRSAGAHILSSPKDIVIQNNVFGSARGDGVGIVYDRCVVGSFDIAVLTNNAFVGTKSAMRRRCSVGTVDQDNDNGTVVSMETSPPPDPPAVWSNNVRVADSCGGATPSTCSSACTNLGQCTTQMIAGWSYSTSGMDTLFGEGFKLAATIPCFVAQGAAPLLPAIDVDGFGAKRTDSGRSMGAHEQDSCAIDK